MPHQPKKNHLPLSTVWFSLVAATSQTNIEQGIYQPLITALVFGDERQLSGKLGNRFGDKVSGHVPGEGHRQGQCGVPGN